MKVPSAELLEQVFGVAVGSDVEASAKASDRIFVRSIDQLALATDRAKGRRLSAREALMAYGFDVLREVSEEGSALLAADVDAAGRVLRERRATLGLTTTQVARRAALVPTVVEALELSQRRPVREYERVARVLGLDERMVSYRAEPEGNERIAVRLRTMFGTNRGVLSASTVAALAEASWVAATQTRLQRSLGLDQPSQTFTFSDDYGSRGWPAWQAGFVLARKVRDDLQFDSDPIPSLRDMCERSLRIPVIQAELGDDIAGATVESDGCRAVVLNLSGRNREVFIRRATLAHELGHILFDPPRRLEDLRVDRYDELERSVEQPADPVEQRANAFAVELIAPQSVAVKLYQTADDEPLRAVMEHFGVSFTAARYQIWNGLDRKIAFGQLQASNYPPDPSWEARESYTVDYHPIRSLAQHPSRAGRFSAIVLRAATEGLISWDSAAEWLMTDEYSVRAAQHSIREFFPDVFE